ncbi:BolA family protein [Niveispirillum irakense]|uniref:BolA family protein n=1 Tax=Niveispirillum irakense TaxID=34011 RepID=UPI00042A2203|nr:BolA family protein [Niveispirillum irakense]
MTVYATRIESKLTQALAPQALSIKDVSHQHAGHAGADHPGGETHFDVTIVSDRFQGLGRVARQRLVYDALAAELAERVHALSVRAQTPAEAAAPATHP